MRLFMIIYTLAATVLAGSAIVAVLTYGRTDLTGIVIAAVTGAVVAMPAAWVIARRLVAE